MTATASPLEVLWTIVALMGFVYTWSCVREARKDRRALDAMGRNGSSRLIADATLRTERVLLAVQCLFLTAGLVAMVTPPMQHANTDSMLQVYSIWLPTVFVLAELLLTIDSQNRKNGRRHLLDVLAAEEKRVRAAQATHGQIGGKRSDDPHSAQSLNHQGADL